MMKMSYENIMDDTVEQNKIIEERDDYVDDLNDGLCDDDIDYEEVKD